MILLTLAIDRQRRLGKQTAISVPDSEVRSYLARTGVFEHLGGDTTVTPKVDDHESRLYDIYQGANPLLLELTLLTTQSDISPILDRIIPVLRAQMKYNIKEAFDIAVCISEVWQNSFEHADGAFSIVGAMQVYGEGKRRHLEIALGDDGEGILSSLRNNPSHNTITNDEQAIVVATKPRTSQFTDQTRGNGLSLLINRVFAHKGTIDIRSGSGRIHFRMDKGEAWMFNVPNLKGTQIIISLPTK